ncbi:hypothetical protein EDB80DRAFT_778968 [Ilyonectria destructans]|nr:hypothetical protein EDB80DRAFT_778968 [Ilyonectria destructans]
MATQAAKAELEGVDTQWNQMRDFEVSRALDPKVSDLESRVSELVHELEAARHDANVKAIDSAAEITRLESVIERQRRDDASLDHRAEDGGRRDELAAPTRQYPGGYSFKTRNLNDIVQVAGQAALNSEDGLVGGWVYPIDQKVWARCRQKEIAIRALQTTSVSGMMKDHVATGRRIEEVTDDIEDEDVDEPVPRPVDSNPGAKLLSEFPWSTRVAIERQAAPNPQGGRAPAQTASNPKPKPLPEALFAALRAHRASAVKANPGILTEGFRAAHRDEAQRHALPLVNGSDPAPPQSLGLGDLDAMDNLEGAQGGRGEVSLQDNSSVPVSHSREFDQEQGSDHEMGGQ